MVRFRESFRGYNKDDVNAYIEQININFKRKEDELLGRLNEANEKIAAMETASVNIRDTGSESESNAKIAALISEIDMLRLENERLKDDRTVTAENADSKIGHVLLLANENADKMIAEAREKSDGIIENANIRAEAIIAEAEKKKKELVNGFEDAISGMREEYVRKSEQLISEAKGRFDLIAESYEKQSKEIVAEAGNKLDMIN